ncbi:DUF5672 family protein [Persicitalea jodogahamensis]|uniref:DUF5672 domain-containing protein n=1 Tax=Persicitalea jodogahamensis TaxID=402147 RepID=A0A8J3D3C0_9BACT|nr:DUF5672 family protein [Persicitalea jodogahamensis]GHB75798.1 hypothetical protein GCM10007390_32040 [Persicitalea jodogahamensis]
MKEPVTILIPVFSLPLTAVAMNSLATIQEHLGDFPITFIKGESLTQVEELTEFCPTADYVSFDDRYFSSRTGYAKLLLGTDLYSNFGWSRYLLICEMNTVVTRNELAYWCRQGYDFIQPLPDFAGQSPSAINIQARLNRREFFIKNKIELAAFGNSSGISLRNIEAFQKLTKRKRRVIHQYLDSATNLENDAVFWEFYTNRWWPEMNTPTALSRKRFAQSANLAAASGGSAESPFAISGLTKPVPALKDL